MLNNTTPLCTRVNTRVPLVSLRWWLSSGRWCAAAPTGVGDSKSFKNIRTCKQPKARLLDPPNTCSPPLMPHAALWRDDATEHPTMLAYTTQLVSNAAYTQPCSVPLPLPCLAGGVVPGVSMHPLHSDALHWRCQRMLTGSVHSCRCGERTV